MSFCILQELFVLVTDQGYLKEPNVVWETLSSVDGAGHFVDHRFVTFTPVSSHIEANENSSVLSNIACDQIPSASGQSSTLIGSKNPSAAIHLSDSNSPSSEKDTSLQPNITSKQQIDQE